MNEAINQLYWFSPNSAAYAAGSMGLINRQAAQIEGNIMLGHFGDEYLLLGETAQQQSPPLTTVAGASSPNVLPFVLATAPAALWGEEMFAAGAYLGKKPFHLASLFAQDTLRWLLGFGILGSVILKTLGVL